MQTITGRLISTLLLTALGLFPTSGLWAADKPLLMEGKKTLFQRVLSVPDARLYDIPVDSSESSSIIPFSVLYVYQRGSDWLEVGYDSFGETVGWVRRDKAITWNQALTVSFKDPHDIQRVMLFSDKDELQRMVETYDQQSYQSLYDAIFDDEIPES